MKDQTKISNTQIEIEIAAKTMKVPVSVIHLAKETTKSNDRKTVYDWIEENRGKELAIKF